MGFISFIITTPQKSSGLSINLITKVVEDEEAIDEIFWNGSPSGGFTISSAINIIRNTSPIDEEQRRAWKHIWKIRAPQRIRFFFWLLVQDRLMSNVNRFLRKYTDDPRCFVCGADQEDTDHIIRKCPAAAIVWRKLGWSDEKVNTWESCANWVIRILSEGKKHEDNNSDVAFGVTCWWLWKWRNARCFERGDSVPLDQVAFIAARVREIIKALESPMNAGGSLKRNKVEKLIRWEAPRHGWVKLNTDGASKGNPGKAGAGGIIRGADGIVYEVFAANCWICSSLKAELLGVLRGLVVAWNHGYNKVIVAVDSAVVVQFLVEEYHPHSPYIHVIRKCRALISRSG